MSWWRLLGIGLKNSAYNLFLWFKDVALFCRFPPLWRLWFLLFSHYPFGPWLFLRRGVPERAIPEEDLTYGETPFLTAKAMLEWARLGPADRVVDLGAGTGRVVLLAALLHGAAATGIEAVPGLVRVAEVIARKLRLRSARFVAGDFLEVDFSDTTVVYLAGTTFSPATRARLAERLSALPAGARILSVSAPLLPPSFRVTGERRFSFSWGEETVYLAERAASS